MHISRITILVIAIFFSLAASAQVTPDSITSLKQQKESLALSSKINERKMQLAKLENEVDKKTRAVETTAADAQKAADENNDAASKLSSNPQDKTLARRSRKAANAAEKSAKKARNAANDLSDLHKDIDALKSKIADDEGKLATMPGVTRPRQ